MDKYSVSLIFSADWGIDVEAESPEEAAEKAYDSDFASPSICHHCSRNINIGDCIRVIVYDEDGNEKLDDGIEARENEQLRARIAELERENEALKKDAERLECVGEYLGYSAKLSHAVRMEKLLPHGTKLYMKQSSERKQS